MGAQSSAACCGSGRKPNCLGSFGADLAQKVIAASDRSPSPARRSTLLLPSPSNRTKRRMLHTLQLAEASRRGPRASSRDVTLELAEESIARSRSSSHDDTLARLRAHRSRSSSRQSTLKTDTDTGSDDDAPPPVRLRTGPIPIEPDSDPDDAAQKIVDAGLASLLGRLDPHDSPKEKADGTRIVISPVSRARGRASTVKTDGTSFDTSPATRARGRASTEKANEASIDTSPSRVSGRASYVERRRLLSVPGSRAKTK